MRSEGETRAMTVRELIEALRDAPLDALVVMSKDGEGNEFSPLAEIGTESTYEATSTWSGELHLKTLTPEHVAQGYTDEDVGGAESVACVCLWPVN